MRVAVAAQEEVGRAEGDHLEGEERRDRSPVAERPALAAVEELQHREAEEERLPVAEADEEGEELGREQQPSGKAVLRPVRRNESGKGWRKRQEEHHLVAVASAPAE